MALQALYTERISGQGWEEALAELLYCPETPTNVIINEAIEIAHRYSSNDAGRFVNGILDRLAREVRGA